jgi:hypothetical protein
VHGAASVLVWAAATGAEAAPSWSGSCVRADDGGRETGTVGAWLPWGRMAEGGLFGAIRTAAGCGYGC